MLDFESFQKDNIVIFDGAMGTSIEKENLCTDDYLGVVCNEYLNIVNPHIISRIHTDFVNAGANVIETNTFGANPIVLAEYNLADKCYEINKKAAKIAKAACRDFPNTYVSGSIGPTSKLPTLSHISFGDLYSAYKVQIEALVDGGVDLLQIETSQDMLQIKAALKAANDIFLQKKKRLFCIVQASLETNGRMLLGTSIKTFVATFANCDIVSAIGFNCGVGPLQLAPFIPALAAFCPKPIAVLPNAGLPVAVDGKMGYDLSPSEFARSVSSFVCDFGVEMVGGCCGTTAAFIKELACEINKCTKKSRPCEFVPSATSTFSSCEFKTKPAPTIIGERSNTNGSKKFRELLEKDKWQEMLAVCNRQKQQGAHILDICLSHIGRDEKADVAYFTSILNKSFTLPIMIDTTDLSVAEVAMQNYGGKLIVNSVNFEEGEGQVIEMIKLCKKYGAAFVCLAIDEKGMAKLSSAKLQIFSRLATLCKKKGFPLSDLFFDALTFSAASGDTEKINCATQTLEAIEKIFTQYPQVNLVLGVSNVSFGLSAKIRKVLNSVFLKLAVDAGLTSAIVDSSKIVPLSQIENITAYEDVIFQKKSDGEDPLIRLIKNFTDVKKQSLQSKNLTPNQKMQRAILEGDSSDLKKIIKELLSKNSAIDIINNILLPPMAEVGKLFNKGLLQLPFVLLSAQVVKSSIDILTPHLDKKTGLSKKKMLLATVEGDVHDIGKNLVKIILESNGFEIVDLGVKVAASQILDAYTIHKPNAIGLSGLLIKSTKVMKQNLIFFASNGLTIPVICGGAALTKDFVKSQLQPLYKGRVFYAKDAFDGLAAMQSELV